MTEVNSVALILEPGGKSTSEIVYVPASALVEFLDGVCRGLFAGEMRSHFDFALGFGAAVNALALNMLDFDDPLGTVRCALADVVSTGSDERQRAGFLAAYCEREGARE